jgi:phosphate transport system permease protein
MPPDSISPPLQTANAPIFSIRKKRTSFLGLTLDECIRVFFGGNAFVAVIVLALITFFLFKEGSAFFGQNRDSLRTYRQAGLEYVDMMRQQEQDHTALTRYLFDIRMQAVRKLTAKENLAPADIQARLADFDAYAERYSDTVLPLRGLVSDLTDVASNIKERYNENEDYKIAKQQFTAAGMQAEADAIEIQEIDFKSEILAITGVFPAYQDINREFAASLEELVAEVPASPVPGMEQRMVRFQQLTRQYVAGFSAIEAQLTAWDPNTPVSMSESFSTFIFGKRWLTASFWQDWYGIIPLFVGSLMVSAIALTIAVPLGVGAAIYINQIASPTEQRLVKPAIEFISAIPSVVLGFFGIAVLGQALRTLSQFESLSWIPGFPYAERLNALTAGVLLALIAVPTIFTLAEDAINNVPRAFKEASFALGASRMQTIVRIIVPASLSGIVSAVLLGLGRVIGETMVVLLCAGNRIAIPDFTAGLAVIVQPVHTMTGIIAQEMGEVVRGSIHYRALFVVGLLLFFIALLINFIAQKIVRKYRISIG